MICLPQKDLAPSDVSDRTLQTARTMPKSGANSRRIHRPQLLLQLVDLIAKARRELELQLCGSSVHLVLKLLDEQREVVAGQAGELGGVLAGGLRLRRHARDGSLAARLTASAAADQLLLVAADDVVEDVGDLLAQWLRVDAVGLV